MSSSRLEVRTTPHHRSIPDNDPSTEIHNGSDSVRTTGFYQGWSKATPAVVPPEDAAAADKWEGKMPPGVRAEEIVIGLPASMYQYSMHDQAGSPPRLDYSLIQRPGSSNSGFRSPRFREHLGEAGSEYTLPPTYFQTPSPSTDSPTLGRHQLAQPSVPLADTVRRQQHLAYGTQERTNAAQPTSTTDGFHASSSGRSQSPVGPLSNDEPLDRDFTVSPLFSDRRRDRWQ
jgi:hypothetical protein